MRCNCRPRPVHDRPGAAAWTGWRFCRHDRLGRQTRWAYVRIAGLLHAARSAPLAAMPWETPISGVDMHAAIEIGEYLAEHARIAFSQMGSDSALVGAKQMLMWIERTGVESFSKRDAHQANRGRFQKATEVDAPLQTLVERGYIRPVEVTAAPRRGQAPSPQFDVNPSLRTAESDHNRRKLPSWLVSFVRIMRKRCPKARILTNPNNRWQPRRLTLCRPTRVLIR